MIGCEVNPSTFDITYMRGDAHTIPFAVTTSTGAVQDLTGWTAFKFTVKKSLEDDITAAKFQKTSPSGGITIPTPSNGQVLVAIDSTDTAALDGGHFYDLQATDNSGKTKTLRRARFVIPKNVSTLGGAPPVPTPVNPIFPGEILPIGGLVLKDVVTGKFWLLTMVNGVPDWFGPNDNYPV